MLDNNDDDVQSENSNFTLSFHRKILFDSNATFYNSTFYNFEFFDFTKYISKIAQFSFKSLIVEQINYFDFKKNVKSSNIVTKISFFFDSIIIVSKHTYYKNMYVFVNRLKNQIQRHNYNQIKSVIYDCLRNDAQYWYIYEFVNVIKKTLRHASLNNWYFQFIIRFKFKTFEIMKKIID